MLTLLSIIQGMVSTIITESGLSGSSGTTLPQEIIDKINDVGFWESVPLWVVTLLGSLFITVLSFVMILTVYSRMFRLYMYTAIAPVPLSAFAGEPTSSIGTNAGLRNLLPVCLLTTGSGFQCFSGDCRLELCRGVNLQPAGFSGGSQDE